MIGQNYLIDLFLGFQLAQFGRTVLPQSELVPNIRGSPLHIVFPKVAKCRFNKYGSSGSIQTHDMLCVLAININNKEI